MYVQSQRLGCSNPMTANLFLIQQSFPVLESGTGSWTAAGRVQETCKVNYSKTSHVQISEPLGVEHLLRQLALYP